MLPCVNKIAENSAYLANCYLRLNHSAMPRHYPKYLFLFLSFIEGAAVMATELVGAKMLAPFFGSSLYVWSTVLAMTLGGLAAGYFAGGWLSAKKGSPKTLFICLALAGMFMAAMPVTGKFVMYRIGFYPLIPATLMSSLAFLFPPVFTMGMVSPLIIGNLATTPGESGKYAGLVYGISTIGGIAATFLTGFWIIPEFGLSMPSIVAGILLAIIPTMLLFRELKWFPILVILFFAACILKYRTTKPLSDNIKMRFYQEGLLGQLAVVDFPLKDSVGIPLHQMVRYLTVNRVWQSQFNMDTNKTALPEYDYLKDKFRIAQVQPKNARILTLGLGGGTLQNQLADSNYRVDVCELDPRMVEASRRFFHLRPAVNVTLDDARHFLRLNTRQYDAVFYDLFKGEHPPEHCFTREAFQDVYKRLNQDGVVAINLWGYFSGEKGAGVRSIYATMKAVGFQVLSYTTSPDETQSNLILIGFRKDCSKEIIAKTKDALVSLPVDFEHLKVKSVILNDDFPELDNLNHLAYEEFRTVYIAHYYSLRSQGKEPPVFY